MLWLCFFFFFQAEDGIRDLVRSRGLGDVYKRQVLYLLIDCHIDSQNAAGAERAVVKLVELEPANYPCLLYTSDAADERSSVDLGGRRIIKKKKE